jgi:hypothetical protein
MEGTSRRWLAEGLLIVFGVGVGFAVAELGDYREDRRLEGVVLDNVRAEVEANASILDSLATGHRAWQDALAKRTQRSSKRNRLSTS